MQVTVQRLSPVLVELDVQVEAERVRAEMNRAYMSLARTAKVRGFRPGKAPRKVLAHYFGARIAADVAQRLVEETFPKAMSEHKVQAVNEPAIEPHALLEDKPFSYKARVEVLPQIEQVAYEGLEAKRSKAEVTDEQVQTELEQLRRANSTLEPLSEERPARDGDVVTVDFTVEVGGAPVPGAGGEGFQGELGAGVFLPPLEAVLLGAKVGDNVSATVDMPPSHPVPTLRGKSAVFQVTLKDLKQRVLPEADDEFAKDLGDYETLDDLKKYLRQELEKKSSERAEEALAEELVGALVKKNPVTVPPSLVDRQAQVSEREVLQHARQQGQMGSLSDDLRLRIRADSEMKVRAGLLMAEIAKKEGLKIGEPEIEQALNELAEQTGKNLAKLRAEYRDQQKREMLIGMILEDKVLDIVRSRAKIEET